MTMSLPNPLGAPRRRIGLGRLAIVPFLVFAILGGAVAAIWFHAERQEQTSRQADNENSAQLLAIRVEEFIEVRLGFVRSLRRHWIGGRERFSEENFRAHAMDLIETLGGLQAVNWVDPRGTIRWVVPEEPNRAAIGRDLTRHPVAGATLERAGESGRLQITPPLDLYQGGRGFVAYLRIDENGRDKGFLNVVFGIAPMIDECLDIGVPPGAAFSIRDGDEPVYASGGVPADRAFSATSDIRLGDRTWTLEYWPSAAALAGQVNRGNQFLLVFGLLLALTLSALSWRLLDLRAREQRSAWGYRRILETAQEGIWVIDTATRTRFVNDHMAKMLGHSTQEMIGRSLFDFMDEEVRSQAKRSVEQRRSGVSKTHEFRFRKRDGSHVWTEVATNPLVDERGRYIGAMAMVTDISRRRQAEDERRTTEERLSLALRGADIGLWDWNPATDDLVFDERWTGMLGYEAEELPHEFETMRRLVHPDELPGVLDTLNGNLAGRSEHFESIHRMLHQSGEWRWILARGKVLERDEQGQPVRMTGTHLDVTEQRRAADAQRELEAQVRHTQKLESLGVLSGGIAHDFNNILMAILGNAELARQHLVGEQATARKSLNEIEIASQRAADLCRQMLAYSGQGRSQVESLDLNQEVRGIRKLLDVSVSKKATVVRELTPDLPGIDADRAQIGQITLNLIINASEALGDEQGWIHLRTGVEHCDRDELRHYYLGESLTPGRYVFLEVDDTGSGMEAKVQERIFEPFFTTKFAGRGLGLAAVLGIVRGHGGAIRIVSAPGKGTAFRVLFPPGRLTLPARRVRPTARQAAGGSILVVDDEAPIRKLLTCILEPEGYTVLLATNGREAVDLFRRNGERIDCVLLDRTMPHMGGRQTLAAMREIRPDVPVILCTGYDAQHVTRQLDGDPPAGFLQKPYQRDDLLSMLRKILTHPSPREELRADRPPDRPA